MTDQQQIQKTIERYTLYRDGLAPRIANKEQLIEAIRQKAKGLSGINKYRAIDEVFFEERKLLDLKLEFNRCNDWIANYTQMLQRTQEPNAIISEEHNRGTNP